MTHDNPDLSRHAEERLDRLLAGWARERRLSPGRAENLRHMVLSTSASHVAPSAPVDLGSAWWRGLLDPLVATLSRTEVATLSSVGPGFVSGPAPEASGSHASGYRAYLRLT
jgi:hypothetical protein